MKGVAGVRVGPVISFLHSPECRIIGVTTVDSWMVDYDLAVNNIGSIPVGEDGVGPILQ
jgi:hypothetical protein